MLKDLRNQIDQIDAELVSLIGKRIELARDIARIKKQEGLPILDEMREEEVRTQVNKKAKAQGLSSKILEELIQLILDYSRIEMEAI